MTDLTMTNENTELLTEERAQYPHLLKRIRHNYEDNSQTPLFMTDAADLYDLFLEGLPAPLRQIYNCSHCRSFVNRYGGLVTLDEHGKRTPVMWSEDVPELYRKGTEMIIDRIRHAEIKGIFYTGEDMLGTEETGEWKHMAVRVPAELRYSSCLYTAKQAAAEKNEEYRMLKDTITKYTKDEILQAINMLKSGRLSHEKKFLDNAEWLLDLQQKAEKAKRRNEVLWYAAATAKTGYCHFSNNMIGTLLADIHAGYSQRAIERRFMEKMHPLKYQRPTELPKKQNVERAEEIIRRLNLEDSLKRRFARLDEIETIWKPEKQKEASEGVFKDVPYREKRSEPSKTPVKDVVMTWEKFARTMLKEATKIEYYVPSKRTSYGALVTAAVPDSEPILQWDSREHRNPFSWYLYVNGSLPADWNLKANTFTEVEAVTLKPCCWQPGFEYQGIGVCLILKDCHDVNRPSGLALFPECLKKELREVRSTIEAYSKRGYIDRVSEPNACGLITGDKEIDMILRVTTKYGVTDVYIDRWD
ncbi:MAG: hypothetical protein IKG46_11260 [Solobacterium sp.]|nr:hypothetical protein [Solobacterium sp.]